MKKITLLLVFSLASHFLFAKNEFIIDYKKVDKEFLNLSVLETNIEKGIIVAGENKLASDTTDYFHKQKSIDNNKFTFEKMDWGSFAWGFCCWPVGHFVVLTDNDVTVEKQKSFIYGHVAIRVVGLALTIYSAVSGLYGL
jgi:hypothetical protein